MAEAEQNRRQQPRRIAQARARAALVANAQYQNHEWLGSLPPELMARVSRSPRAQVHLYKILAKDLPNPEIEDDAVCNFYMAGPEQLKAAALCIGLAFDLAALGDALEGKALRSLDEIFGERTTLVALQQAAKVRRLVHSSNATLPVEREMVEANGWCLMTLWAEAKDINPDWRIAKDWSELAMISTVPGELVMALANNVLMDVRALEEVEV
jgi:hypothetical protein